MVDPACLPRGVFRWAGIEAIEAEELSVLPGLDEVFALSDLHQHVVSGKWDVIVVDCVDVAETLRLLSLPRSCRGGWSACS